MKPAWMLVVSLLTSSAHAELMLGNFPPSNDGTSTSGITTTRFKGIGFTNGADIWVLQSVKVRLSLTSTSAIPTVQIRTGMTSSSAGLLVHSLSPPVFVTGNADHTFTSDGTFSFAVNTQYWLVVRNGNNVAGMNWLASNPGLVPTGSATYNQGLFTQNGTSFTGSASLNTFEINGIRQGANARVNGTLVLGDVVSPMVSARTISYNLIKGTATLASGSIVATVPSTAFSISVPATQNGNVRIEFDGGPFLRRHVLTVLTGGNVNAGAANMVNGDVDGSGEIDAADIDLVIADFGATLSGDSDVDSSGEVDAADIDIVIARFGGVDDSSP